MFQNNVHGNNAIFNRIVMYYKTYYKEKYVFFNIQSLNKTQTDIAPLHIFMVQGN